MFFLPSNLFYFLSILEDENCDRFKAVSSQELERKSCSYAVLSSYYIQYKGENGPFLGGPRENWSLHSYYVSLRVIGLSKVERFVKQY